ncbi:MAG: MFS transporter [Alphaproteobacteria bacterium]|nr:MFS transporter [Alphaproteobacteria bacterium]
MAGALSADATATSPGRPRLAVTSAIGIAQILAWGSSFYLPAVLATPIARATGWSQTWIIGALSLGLLISGLISPHVGHLIQRFGGRPVLAASAILLAAGQVIQAVAPNLPVFVAAWAVLGLGMGAGLYDPAFATLGRLYGEHARGAITQVTLFGGFAATLCWPLSALLVEQVGWRGACLAYAAINILVVLPLYLFGVPREERHVRPQAEAGSGRAAPPRPRRDRPALIILGAGFTLAAGVMTIMSVNLLAMLQARGLSLAAAVGLGVMIGPAQVAGRVLEALVGRRYHPVWSLLVSAVLVAVGFAVLLGPAAIIGVGFVLYGAGSGIRSITRGTVPLALFGQEGYALLIGWLAMPSLLATAISPPIGALLLAQFGADQTLTILAAASAANILLVLPLVPLAMRRAASA